MITRGSERGVQADLAQFPGTGEPWQPAKLYYNLTFHKARVQALHQACLDEGVESPYADWLANWEDKPEDAARLKARGRHCILVVTETGPTDIEGMKAATGILTARGGMTSHAGVIARITGKPCVAGVRTLSVNQAELTCKIGKREFRQGDRITIDGTDGSVYLGALPLAQPHIGGAMGKLLGWSDASRQVSVRANAETVEAVATAKLNDAQSLEDACVWLKRKERLAVLGDRALIALLARLPEKREPFDEAEGEAVAGYLAATGRIDAPEFAAPETAPFPIWFRLRTRQQ